MTGEPRPPACPICGKPQHPQARPFCSPRCADVDLQRWFSGRYVIPVAGQDDDEEAGSDGREAELVPPHERGR